MHNKILVVLTFLALILVSPNFFSYHVASSSGLSTCSSDVQASQEATILASMNLAQAQNLAQPSINALSNGLKSNFDTMAGVFGQNPDCSVYVEVYKLEYSLSNASGVQRVAVVDENPTISSVINASTQEPVYFSVGNCNNLPGYSCNDAGYLYTDTFMKKIGASFNQPSGTEAWNGQCDLANCDISFWVGMQDGNAGNYLVQTGNDAGVYCAFGSCTYYKYTWYEDYPSPSLNRFNTNAGDQITAQAYYSRTVPTRYGPETFYDTYLKDNTNGQSCSSDWSPGPAHILTTTWAEFVGETPEKCCWYYEHLPKFSPAVTFSGGYYVNNGGTTVTIGSNWAYEWVMNNGQYCTNIANSGVSSGSFSETWQNSCGT